MRFAIANRNDRLIIDKCRICGTEGKTIVQIISSAPCWLKANIRNVMIYSHYTHEFSS
jgi:hypothetical protein